MRRQTTLQTLYNFFFSKGTLSNVGKYAQFTFALGHPNKVFRFPLSRKSWSVGRAKKKNATEKERKENRV